VRCLELGSQRQLLNSRHPVAEFKGGIYCEEAEDPGTLGAMVAAAKCGVKVRFIVAVLKADRAKRGRAEFRLPETLRLLP
jgi:hypothetical protein